MEVNLARIDDAFLMESTNDTGNTVLSDGSPKVGGSNQAMRPMQMVLAAMGSCSSIDVISLLKKMRQPLDDIKIKVTAERAEDQVPAVFTKIHMHYQLYGALDESKAEKACRMSVEQYCSVSKMLEKAAEVTWSMEVIES